jgi:SAM-dependent methyltransferase
MSSEENNKNEPSQRAKARWAILRSALRKEANGKRAMDKHSIHRYSFQMLQRNIINGDNMNLYYDQDHLDDKHSYDYIEYIVPIAGTIAKKLSMNNLVIYTKERKMNDIITTQELISHQQFGVDNTGNKRVWDCSNILAYLIMGSFLVQPPNDYEPVIESLKHQLSPKDPFIGLDKVISLSQPCKHNPSKRSLKVLELGAGMAALPSMSLMALYKNIQQETNDIFPEINVTITDGHPNAVSNNRSSFDLCASICKWRKSNDVHFQRLLWKGNDEGAKECQDMIYNSSSNDRYDDRFDLCLVSDCVHFTDFHADLAITIGRTLRIGGKCLLLQPPRGRSLQKFLTLIDALNQGMGCENPLFEINIHDYYNDEVYQRHLAAMKHADYDPNIHFPVLLILEKLRNYDECLDSKSALDHSKLR